MTRADFVDANFVASKRAMRASWSAIAAMTGCSEIELRKKFDPGLTIQVPSTVSPLSPRMKAERALIQAGLGRDAAVVVARLWHAGGAIVGSEQLARGIAGGGAARDVCKAARDDAKRRLGLTFCVKGFGLTPGDLVAVSRMIDAWEAEQ
jgi:hypothetical protein